MNLYNKYIINKRKYINIKTGYVIKIFFKKESKNKKMPMISGICISIKNKNISSRLKIRKILNKRSMNYDKTYFIYSPLIEKIKILKKYKYRKSKLYNINKTGNLQG